MTDGEIFSCFLAFLKATEEEHEVGSPTSGPELAAHWFCMPNVAVAPARQAEAAMILGANEIMSGILMIGDSGWSRGTARSYSRGGLVSR